MARPARRPPWRAPAAALALAVGLGLGGTAAGQGGSPFLSMGTGPPVVTLDQDRLFADSAFGQRVEEMVEEAARNLMDENRRLEEELTAEERALTELRPELPVDEFRAMADAFDTRVEEIRRSQEAKGRAIGAFRDAERQRFFEVVVPILTQVVYDAGAVAVLDTRAVVLSVDDIDITDRVRSRVDAVLGDGGRPEMPGAGPAPTPNGVEHGDTSRPGRPPPPRPPLPAGPPLDLPLPGTEDGPADE